MLYRLKKFLWNAYFCSKSTIPHFSSKLIEVIPRNQVLILFFIIDAFQLDQVIGF
jgi:hypothetical protein